MEVHGAKTNLKQLLADKPESQINNNKDDSGVSEDENSLEENEEKPADITDLEV